MTVGVTGGMGAGKSTVSGIFATLGARVIEADKVGHEVLLESDVIGRLSDVFGPGILDPDGRIDRRALGELAFHTDLARERLEAVVRPTLSARLNSQVQAALKEDPTRPVVIDAALLVEWGQPRSTCDVLVVVTADRETRLVRTVERLGISRAEAERRLAAQLPDSEKIKVADHVIRNEGSHEDLVRSARAVWLALSEAER